MGAAFPAANAKVAANKVMTVNESLMPFSLLSLLFFLRPLRKANNILGKIETARDSTVRCGGGGNVVRTAADISQELHFWTTA